MPNLAQSIKAEIARISRKEIKSSVGPLHSSNITLKKTAADLKKRVAFLERENKRLSLLIGKLQPSQPEINPDEKAKVRITSQGIRKLRGKLGLSQDSFAKLLGVSSQNVYMMEHKDGKRLKLRQKTLTNLITVRGMGKREVKKKLETIKP